jgi:hypothetical protein
MTDTPEVRDLSLFQVEMLLKSTAAQEASKSRSVAHWLGIADTKLLLTAIDYDAEQVYLSNVARWYNIQYREDKVWLSPSNSDFVPCGWFTVAALRREVKEFSVTA